MMIVQPNTYKWLRYIAASLILALVMIDLGAWYSVGKPSIVLTLILSAVGVGSGIVFSKIKLEPVDG